MGGLMRMLFGEALRGGGGTRRGRPGTLIGSTTIRHLHVDGGPCEIVFRMDGGPRGRMLGEKVHVDADGYDVVELEWEIDPS